ncbi:MAG: stage II sporulation protein M [Anaerolineales bacterium]|nr:stage II sporulation protein M [Anaerolineales bacterium]
MIASMRPALILTRREVRDQLRDWRMVIPVIAFTLLFPLLMNFTASIAISFVERYGAEVIGDRLIPFLLMIVGFFPLSISLVVALESFVGEKERRSIEPLLSTPLTDSQIYIGKLLAVLIPPLMAAFLGIGVYLFGIYWRVGWTAEPAFIVQILLLTVLQGLVMVSGAVVISSQATSVRAANLLASLIIIPVAFLVQGEALMLFWGRYDVIWMVIVGLVVLAALLIRSGISRFNREELLGRELDQLNLAWGWGTFRMGFAQSGRSVWEWYRRDVFPALGEMKLSLLLVAVFFALAIFYGVSQAEVYSLPPELLQINDLQDGSIEGFDAAAIFSDFGAARILFHNIRAMILALLLGVFSFGVLGVVVLMAPPVLVGYFMETAASTGFPAWKFMLAFILPHGIFEIPAILLASAALLKMGASIAAPGDGKSFGDVMIHSVASWTKIMLGVIIPLLILAAFMEAVVTPLVVNWFLS